MSICGDHFLASIKNNTKSNKQKRTKLNWKKGNTKTHNNNKTSENTTEKTNWESTEIILNKCRTKMSSKAFGRYLWRFIKQHETSSVPFEVVIVFLRAVKSLCARVARIQYYRHKCMCTCVCLHAYDIMLYHTLSCYIRWDYIILYYIIMYSIIIYYVSCVVCK